MMKGNNMNEIKIPADFSFIVLIHGGSYVEYSRQLKEKFPNVRVLFSKTINTHYHIEQIITDDEELLLKLYLLPIIGIREEFSRYIFFKTYKAYSTVLKIMNKSGKQHSLISNMLSSYEKEQYCRENGFSNIFYKEKSISTVNNLSLEDLTTLFGIEEFSVDKKNYSFEDLIKNKIWKVGIKKV